jgi:hypothetical protein
MFNVNECYEGNIIRQRMNEWMNEWRHSGVNDIWEDRVIRITLMSMSACLILLFSRDNKRHKYWAYWEVRIQWIRAFFNLLKFCFKNLNFVSI